MTLTRPRTRTTRLERRRILPAPTPEPVRAAAPVTADELEELLLAVGDREDHVGPDARARLERGRRFLEYELVRTLAR